MAAERAEAAGGGAGGAGGELPPYAGWAPAELQATLAGIGAPAQGTREELVERLQAYTMQGGGPLTAYPIVPPKTGIVLSRPVLRPEEGDKAAQPPLPAQLPGLPLQHPLVPPPPPGLGLSYGLGVGVPPPPPPPGLRGPGAEGLSEEERLTLAQQQAALLLQEERAQQGQHPFGDKAKEQELLEQQKRVRMGGAPVGGSAAGAGAAAGDGQAGTRRAPAPPRMWHPWVPGLLFPPEVSVTGLTATPGSGGTPPLVACPLCPALDTPFCHSTGSTPMGAPMPGVPMGAPRPRGPPPPPGEESREPDDPTVGPKIPQALEKILQLKEIRQEELITVPGLSAEDEMETEPRASASASEAEEDAGLSKKEVRVGAPFPRCHPGGGLGGSPGGIDPAGSTLGGVEGATASAATARRRSGGGEGRGKGPPPPARGDPETPGDAPAVEIEYITEEPEIYDPNFVFFKRIFEAFKLTDDVKKDKEKEPDKADRPESATVPKKKGFEDGHKGSEDDSSEDEQEKKPEVPKLSKKKLRRMNRFTVAELKQVTAPGDVSLSPPCRHPVPVEQGRAGGPPGRGGDARRDGAGPQAPGAPQGHPQLGARARHWCFKRKYLQGKRGIEKPPFELPDFIKRTGIQEMREALQEKVGQPPWCHLGGRGEGKEGEGGGLGARLGLWGH
ncbi:hypothetical protein QYF61_018276, partial [Mycteria americana]